MIQFYMFTSSLRKMELHPFCTQHSSCLRKTPWLINADVCTADNFHGSRGCWLTLQRLLARTASNEVISESSHMMNALISSPNPTTVAVSMFHHKTLTLLIKDET
jgi:hypothetical protein